MTTRSVAISRALRTKLNEKEMMFNFLYLLTRNLIGELRS